MATASESPSPPIACNLDALSAAERSRRSELALLLRGRANAIAEGESGFRIELPNDPELLRNALELVLLERRCCPFLSLELSFAAGDGPAALQIGGPPGVKEFLAETGVFGCAIPAARDACC